jgi:hypothetical protein
MQEDGKAVRISALEVDDPAPIQRHNHAFPNVSYLSHIHLVM